MQKIFILIIISAIYLNCWALAIDNQITSGNKDIVIKTKLFSVTLPEKFKGLYETKIEKDKVSIYHKASKKAGFGGFAFGIKAYKNPSDYATLPGGRKIGEMRDKKGILYDVVLKYPTDVQYDYTKSSVPPENYKLLYDLGESIDIQGMNGSSYFRGQGTKGKDLYNDVLQRHITALEQKWDSTKLEKENMSYMYNLTDKIGYIYYDVNGDGIDELLIGENASGNWKGVIYDIYTVVNRIPKHVASGGTRNRYFVCDDSFICNEYSSGALESGVRVYNLVENSTELFPQVSFKYDGYKKTESPYFLSYGNGVDSDEWENVTKEKFQDRKKVFEKYVRFDFIPLSEVPKNFEHLADRYNYEKDYFDYSLILTEFPDNYYYTTVKINKSKERILIITDKVNNDKTANHGLFYYFANNGFVYPLGYMESDRPLMYSENYLYIMSNNSNTKLYMSDKKLEIVKSEVLKLPSVINTIKFDIIKSVERFKGDYGEPAGNDIVKVTIDGFYFEYHKNQYRRKYIKHLMKECIKDGVKTQVQMYCQMVKKLHP